MDFALSEELKMLRTTVRQFIEKELFPLEQDYLRTEQIDSGTYKALQNKAREIGLWAIPVPKEYGGTGMSTLATNIVEEESKRTVIPFFFMGSIPHAVKFSHRCTPEQRDKYLKPLMDGKTEIAIAYTEPSGGSDVQGAIKTTAVRDDDMWVINGTKTFITNGARSDIIQVLCVTDKEKAGIGGMTWFFVEKTDPGFKMSHIIPTMGTMFETTELTFDNVRIPDSRRYGAEGDGFYIAYDDFAENRVWHASWAIGMSDRCLGDSVEYAKQRVSFGEPIANRQMIQTMLADSAIQLHASRLMTYHCAWMFDQGLPIRNEAFYCKQFATEMSLKVSDQAIQIHGGYGYSKELPYQLFYRNARLLVIGHGTTEINKWMIARNLLTNKCSTNLL